MNKLSFRQCLTHLLFYIKPYRKKMILGILMIVLAQITFAINPTVEGMITTQLAEDMSNVINHVTGVHIQMDVVFKILWVLFIIYIIKTLSQYFMAFFLTDAIQNTMFDIRNDVEDKIHKLPISYFDSEKTGELLSRITNDVDTLSGALQQTFSRVISAGCTFLFVFFMMLRINCIMTFIVFCMLPIIAFLSNYILKRSQPLFDKQQNTLAKLNGTINELYDGYQEIIMYNQQDRFMNIFKEANENMREAGFKAQFASSLISPLCSLVTYLTIGSVALYGCLQVMYGNLLLGQLQAFIRYIWQINDPISQVSQLSSQIQSSFSAMSRLFMFLEKENIKDIVSTNKIDEIQEIEFEHVCFGYTDEPLMEDVNFKVTKGQTVAIVGPTGAGKTTLTNLLLRFYDIKSGHIRINGMDIRELSYKDLRNLFGLVLQDAWLFEGSIEENIKYGNRHTKRCDVIEACKAANVHHYVCTLSKGYDTMINEEASNISQGEKQLLTIARAILKNPKILILDEATSSVDTRLEKRLQKAMDCVMKNRTSFVIAHRLSTIVEADQILVMDHGDIVEHGTHEELLKLNKVYAKLYNAQFSDI